ncbi:unnamed protein product [Trichobilharzia szidati]|nr:unnamed protein product [Trichobilharzia szidati]
MDREDGGNHSRSTSSASVSSSTLWTRLISSELQHVQKDAQLSSRLLNKQVINSKKINQYTVKANSTKASASFYYRIVSYIDENATNDLRRIISFIHELGSGNVSMKSSKKAQYYRELGNDLFKQGNFTASATAYRTGLLHAPNAYVIPSNQSKQDEFCLEGALLHGNLSAVLAVQHLWSCCLEEVLTALELHLSITNLENFNKNSSILRLKTRLDKCCKHLNLPKLIDWDHDLTLNRLLEIHCSVITILNEKNKTVMKKWEIPTPKYQHNSEYYGLSNGVRVDQNNEKGRHVIATESFEPGDIIAVEPAGGWITHPNSNNNNNDNNFKYLLLLPSQRMNQCSKCFSQLNSIGFICPYCCDTAYCQLSSDCNYHQRCREIKNSAAYLYEDFQQPVWHLAECRFMFLLNSIGLGHLCFRLAWLRQSYPDTQEASDFSIDQLVEHFNEFPVEELFEYALTGWLISKLLNYNNNHTKLKSAENENELIQGLWCFDTLRRLQCNAHAITEIQTDYPDLKACLPDTFNVSMDDLKEIYPFVRRLKQARIATGLFPCVSLLNHSCDPNIIHNFENSLIVLRCLKTILSGSEVLNCYGPHYLHYPSSCERLSLLKQQYFFICNCQHCTTSTLDSKLSNHLSTNPTDEMLNQWKQAVDKLLSIPWESIQSLDKLKTAIQSVQQAGTLPSTHCWWPLNDTLGSLFDTIGRQYLIHSKLLQKHQSTSDQPNWLFAQNAGLWCLKSSVQWVQLNFGPISCEYLWELINLLHISIHYFGQFDLIQLNLPGEFSELDEFIEKKVVDSVGVNILSSKDALLCEIKRLSTLLYGLNKSQMIIEQFVNKFM